MTPITPINTAQEILKALGVDPLALLVGKHKRGRLPSNTKKGPGRIHMQGKKEEETNETN